MIDSYLPGHLDFQLAFHCAPAIAGIKTANLISLSRKKGGDPVEQVRRYGAALGRKGIRIHPLREDGRRALLLVYNEPLLQRHLSQEPCRALLRRCGYQPERMTLPQMLDHLARRLGEGDGEFPHEIGVFLGYPMDDVLGFIRHKGCACKLSGYWKVYGDAEQARYTFTAYDAARDFYCHRVLRGETIHTIHYGGQCI